MNLALALIASRSRPQNKPSVAASAIRAVGRQLWDPKLFVFGVGRYELRGAFLTGYAVFTQRFAVSALVKVAEQRQMLRCLQVAVVALQQMAGVLRMVCLLLSSSTRRRGALSVNEARLMIKVFGGHLLWRWSPSVAQALPDLLLPPKGRAPSFKGVELKAPRFQEPPPRNAASRNAPPLRQGPTPAGASPVVERFAAIADALSELSGWLRLEGRAFERRIMFWDGDQLQGDAASEVGPPLKEEADFAQQDMPTNPGLTMAAEVSAEVELSAEMVDAAESPGLQNSSLQQLALARCGALSGGVSGLSGSEPEESLEEDLEAVAGEVSPNPLEEGTLWHLPPRVRSVLPAWKQPLRPSLRRLFWEAASATFHPNILLQTEGVADVRPQVLRVFAALEPLLFRWRPGDLHGWRSPPLEMFERIDAEDFFCQYERFRKVFIPATLRDDGNSHVVDWTALVRFWDGDDAWLPAWALQLLVPGRQNRCGGS